MTLIFLLIGLQFVLTITLFTFLSTRITRHNKETNEVIKAGEALSKEMEERETANALNYMLNNYDGQLYDPAEEYIQKKL